MIAVELMGRYKATVEGGVWTAPDLPAPWREALITFSWPSWSPQGYWPDLDLGYAEAVIEVLTGKIMSQPEPEVAAPGMVF